MAFYLLYGSRSEKFEEAKDRLESVLGVKLDARESAYQGEYFQWGRASDEHFVLKRNQDPLDGECAEENFPEQRVLFYLNDIRHIDDLRERVERVEGFTLLRHEDLE